MYCLWMVCCVSKFFWWSLVVMVKILRMFDGDVFDMFCYWYYGML